MRKEQGPQGRGPAALSTAGRELILAGFTRLLLLVALLASIQLVAHAQSCLDQCQGTLSQCMQSAGGDPVAEARCQDRYDACAQGCM
ncbi:MAG: hypothetical protein ACLGJB_25940 [Blastocatellia bacterium]